MGLDPGRPNLMSGEPGSAARQVPVGARRRSWRAKLDDLGSGPALRRAGLESARRPPVIGAYNGAIELP